MGALAGSLVGVDENGGAAYLLLRVWHWCWGRRDVRGHCLGWRRRACAVLTLVAAARLWRRVVVYLGGVAFVVIVVAWTPMAVAVSHISASVLEVCVLLGRTRWIDRVRGCLLKE